MIITKFEKMARSKGSGITNLRFNQDQGCFTCCMTTGLRVYNVEPLVEKSHYNAEELGAVLACEMMGRSSVLLVVRAARPCALAVLDDARRRLVAEVLFQGPVLELCARRDKIAVVLSGSIHVLSWPGLARVALLRTPAAPRALCSLAGARHAPHAALAAPAVRRGAVQLLDLSTINTAASRQPAVLACHSGALACLALAASGARLATASARGTLVRVWDAVARVLLHELRRGSDAADVYCINFNPSATLVCCVSDKGTLHVWRADGERVRSGALAAALGVPNERRAVATAAARRDTRARCAFVGDSSFVAICEDGSYHKFTFSMEGTCHKDAYEEFLLVGDDDDFIT